MGAVHHRPSATICVIRGPDNPPTTPLATRKGRHVGAVREPPLILPTHPSFPQTTPSFPRGLPRTPIRRREPRTLGQKGAGHHSPSAKICVIRGSDNNHLTVPHICTTIRGVHTFGPRSTDPGNLSSQHLARGTRTNTLTASTDTFKIDETIVDRVGGYNFLPTLIESCSRRRQCPLYLVNSESSFLGCAGNDRCIKGWSRGAMQPPHHKPIDSARVGTGQSRRRGRVRCQSHFIAWERRRREPGSNSVIITIALTRDEGYVVGLGGLQRVRKIFVGCPAIRPIWDQSPGRTASRFETVGNRLYPLHDQDCLRRFTAEAQIQDRSRKSTGLNTAPGFLRVPRLSRKARHSRAGGNPEKNKARHLPLSRRREPTHPTPGIPRSHRFARSRPLRFAKGR